jgi:hypothetical protein
VCKSAARWRYRYRSPTKPARRFVYLGNYCRERVLKAILNVFDTLQKDQDAMDDSSTASLTIEQLIKKLNEHSAVTKGRKKDILRGTVYLDT